MGFQLQQFKYFILKGFLFFLPLAVFFGFLTLLLHFAGELASVNKIIQMQNQQERQILAGLAYSNPDNYYKMQAVLQRQPEILALGTSRTMPISSIFFSEPSKFYNAGGAVEKIGHFKYFLSNIPQGKEPKTIIMGLDQYFFNENFDSLEPDDISQRLQNPPQFGGVWQSGIIGLLKDYAKKKYSLKDIFWSKNKDGRIGLNAIVNSNGFLNDGSYYYGKIMQDPKSNPDYQFKDTFKRIEQGNRRFEYGKDVSEGAVRELEEFLLQAKERNIHVVAFLPPYANAVYMKMKEMEQNYGYIFKLEQKLQPVFENYGFSLYDFSDLASMGASDEETTDGFHGSEKAYLRLFILMAKDDKILKSNTDIKSLSDILQKSEGNFYVFNEASL